jgi:phosphatidylglycerophosphate synthase
VTLSRIQAVQQALAFKAYEIEELADIYFFRPLGGLIAYAAKALRVTPTEVTVAAALIGLVGGSLLYDERLGLLDGQLARLTGQTTELGRILDGLAGYVTYAGVYSAIVAGSVERGGRLSIVYWAAFAAVTNVVHAQMYD